MSLNKFARIAYVDFDAPVGTVPGVTSLIFTDHNGASLSATIPAGETDTAPMAFTVGDWSCHAQTIDANTSLPIGPAVDISFSVTGEPTTVKVSIVGGVSVIDAG